MKRALAPLALLLMGASDSYGPPLKSPCVAQGRIESFIVMVREPDEVARLFRQMHPREDKRTALAFVAVNRSTGEKLLVLPALRGQTDRERLELWGHELAHIVCGRYHDVTDHG